MKKTVLVLGILTLWLASTRACLARSVPEPSAQEIEEFFSSLYSRDEPGAAVIVTKGENVVLRRGYGVSDLATMSPIVPSTMFWLGSISKQFAAVGILLLVQEGRVRLSDPITRFIPEFPRLFSHVSIENLLTHTSGLRNFSNLPEFDDANRRSHENVLASIRDHSLSFNPGQGWEYSDSNYYLAGVIIERVSRMNYCDFIQRRLLGPLGMSRTKCAPSGKFQEGLSRGYLRGAYGVAAAAVPDSKFYFAAGAITSTVEDLALWHSALAKTRLLTEDLQRRVFEPAKLRSGETTIYGYGWVVHDIRGLRVLEHGGLIGGFENHILWIPGEEIFVAILTNQRGGVPNPDTVATRVALALSSRRMPLQDRAPGSLSIADVYQAEGRAYDVTEREEGIVFRRIGGEEAYRLFQLEPGVFVLENTATLISALSTQDGSIWALSVKAKYGKERLAIRTFTGVYPRLRSLCVEAISEAVPGCSRSPNYQKEGSWAPIWAPLSPASPGLSTPASVGPATALPVRPLCGPMSCCRPPTISK